MTSSPSDGRPSIGVSAPGYRLPSETRLGQVRLQVAELNRSIEFYNGVLGFSLLSRSAGAASLCGLDGTEPLVVLEERPDAHPVPQLGRLGLFHVAFLLPQRADLANFLRHLAEARVPVGMSDHLVSEAVYLSDPDGHGIEVYVDRPRTTWHYDGPQIAMATEPLDVPNLLRAAGDTRWTGAPRGTVIGHVHLHVGELNKAAAFYHGALGLDKMVWSYPGALFLSAGGYHHHLGLNTWAAGSPPAGEDEARLLEWTLILPATDDVDAAARSLETAGYTVAWDARACLVADPSGTPLRITSAS